MSIYLNQEGFMELEEIEFLKELDNEDDNELLYLAALCGEEEEQGEII